MVLMLCMLNAGSHSQHAESGAAEAVRQRRAAPAQQRARRHPAAGGGLVHLAAGPVRAPRRLVLGAQPARTPAQTLLQQIANDEEH